MGRVIGENVQNKLLIKDQLSGGIITLFYRTPTTEERVAYKLAQFERTEGRVRSRVTEARQDFGEKILLGFEEGSFQFKSTEGELRTFSSNPGSDNYDPEWKSLLRKYAVDVLEYLAEHCFEGAIAIASQEDFSSKN
jgi:hypothetical protein